MSPKMDPRTRRTQLLIRDAFMALLVEQGFGKISVQAISQRAHINRATFYRHYTDINDLVSRLTDLLFADVSIQTHQLETDDVETWVILFEHVAQYATFYRAMMGPTGIPSFRDRVQKSVEEEMQQRLAALNYDEAQAKMPLALVIRYMAAAQVGFIQWWLEHDMPLRPLEAAQHLMSLHTYGGAYALGLA